MSYKGNNYTAPSSNEIYADYLRKYREGGGEDFQPAGSVVYHDPFPALMEGGWMLEFSSVPVGHGPGGTLSVKFPAAITKFSDNYKSNWKRDAVFGRSDPIQSFQNTERTISFGWQLASASLKEAQKNLSSTSKLIRMLYPPHHELWPSAHGRPAIRVVNGSPLIKLRFANLISNASNGDELVGTLDGITHEPMVEAGFFTDYNGNMYPKVVSFDCTFYPMHMHELGYDTSWEDEEAASFSAKSPKFKKFPYSGPTGPELQDLLANEVATAMMWADKNGDEVVIDPEAHQAAMMINTLSAGTPAELLHGQYLKD